MDQPRERQSINHYLGHETDVTDTGALIWMGRGKRNGESQKGKERRKEMVEKPSFALGRSQQGEKSRKAEERERVLRRREVLVVWRARERAREGLPGAAIGPSAVMPGAEKHARRPLMEAGMLKLRVVVSTLSPGTAVRPLPLELSYIVSISVWTLTGHLSSVIAELFTGREWKKSHCITSLSEYRKLLTRS